MNTPAPYTMPQPLLQAVVDYLNTQPAGAVRQLLNAIEGECMRQDLERTAAPQQAAKPARRRKAAPEAPTP